MLIFFLKKGQRREQTTKLFGTWIVASSMAFKRSKQKTGRRHEIKIELRSPETDKASESKPFQKEQFSSSNHWFSGAMLVSGRLDTRIEAVVQFMEIHHVQ